jgi:hypothetical protein
LASKFGADCNLLVSPVKTKLGCSVLVLVPAALAAGLEDGLKSIHGTATCLPPATEVGEVIPEGLDVAPGVGLIAPAPAPSFNEIIANSSRPEAGLTIVSVIVPTSLPEELVI